MAFPTDMDSVADGALDGGIEGLKIYTRLIDARIILSWFPQIARNEMLAPLVELTRAVTDPYLNKFRTLGLTMGGMDFSLIPAIMILSVGRNYLIKTKRDRIMARRRGRVQPQYAVAY